MLFRSLPPTSTITNLLGQKGVGVVVLDMNDPTHPVRTTTLTSVAMLSPHESLLVNKKRGILAAVLGNPSQNIGVVDLYDVGTVIRVAPWPFCKTSQVFKECIGVVEDVRDHKGEDIESDEQQAAPGEHRPERCRNLAVARRNR